MFSHLRVALYTAFFNRVHTMPPFAQRAWQEQRMRRLVRHAARHVPLWKELLRDAGISADSIQTLQDFASLPVTSKQTFVGRAVEECIDNSRRATSNWYVTSGTSGEPFQFLMSEQAIDEAFIDFASLRFLWWRGMSIGDISAHKHTRIKIRGVNNATRQFIPVADVFSDLPGVLGRIAAFRPFVLSAYPSILLEISRRLREEPALPRINPPFVLSIGEMLSPSVRALATETLGCEIYDRYGLEEIGVIGVECAMHDGFHLNTESVLVEVTDDQHVPLPEGTEGRIVATDLLNYNMPFIRYVTGDHGYVSYEPCACGLKSPRLWIKGRYSSYLAFPSRRIHHLEFDGAMDGFMHAILKYQVAKVSDERIVVRIVPGPAYHESVNERVAQSVGGLVGPGISITTEIVSEVPTTPRGKSRIVVDESA